MFGKLTASYHPKPPNWVGSTTRRGWQNAGRPSTRSQSDNQCRSLNSNYQWITVHLLGVNRAVGNKDIHSLGIIFPYSPLRTNKFRDEHSSYYIPYVTHSELFLKYRSSGLVNLGLGRGLARIPGRFGVQSLRLRWCQLPFLLFITICPCCGNLIQVPYQQPK